MCNACTKCLGKQKALGGDTPSGGGKPTNHRKNVKANGTEVKDPIDPMQPPPARTAELKRDIENKKDYEDLKLRKACQALMVVWKIKPASIRKCELPALPAHIQSHDCLCN
jgi:hypothetical protein